MLLPKLLVCLGLVALASARPWLPWHRRQILNDAAEEWGQGDRSQDGNSAPSKRVLTSSEARLVVKILLKRVAPDLPLYRALNEMIKECFDKELARESAVGETTDPAQAVVTRAADVVG